MNVFVGAKFAAAINRKATDKNTMRLQSVSSRSNGKTKYSQAIVTVFTSAAKQSYRMKEENLLGAAKDILFEVPALLQRPPTPRNLTEELKEWT